MEFSSIQPVSNSEQIHLPTKINAVYLSYMFDRHSNAGDQIEMFFSIAEGQPEAAISSFDGIITDSPRSTLKALALQGLGKIPKLYKQGLTLCQSTESRKLLKLLCNEIKNNNNDLTAWAAAEALREIGFSLDNILHSQGGNLPESPRRIQDSILDRKLAEVKEIKVNNMSFSIGNIRRLNNRGKFTVEYEKFLEFWIYGPTIQIFEEGFESLTSEEGLESEEYIEIVNDILHFTQIRGIQLGLNSSNKKIQELSLNKIKSIFRQYIDLNEGDFKKDLGNSLSRFLKESTSSESDLVVLTQALLHEEPRYDIDTPILSRLTYDQIHQEINHLKSLGAKILDTFSSALSVSSERTINDCLLEQKNRYLNLIRSWIQGLEEQLKIISSFSTDQKSNFDLIISVTNSIKTYDESLYLKVSHYISQSYMTSLKQQGIQYSSLTQENQNVIENEINQIRKLIESSLSENLKSTKNEIRSLEEALSENETNRGHIVIGVIILFIVSVFPEVIAYPVAGLVWLIIVVVRLIIAILVAIVIIGGIIGYTADKKN